MVLLRNDRSRDETPSFVFFSFVSNFSILFSLLFSLVILLIVGRGSIYRRGFLKGREKMRNGHICNGLMRNGHMRNGHMSNGAMDSSLIQR